MHQIRQNARPTSALVEHAPLVDRAARRSTSDAIVRRARSSIDERRARSLIAIIDRTARSTIAIVHRAARRTLVKHSSAERFAGFNVFSGKMFK